ncbi:MAG: type II toxin-antitoxin system HigB family toxin [Bacteroidota bacterium]
MRVLSKTKLRDFWLTHPDAEKQLKEWYKVAVKSDWKNPYEIKSLYPKTSIIPGDRLVFNIKGNTYRLIVKISYHYQMIYVRFIGTHSEYDKIDVATI